MQRIKCFACGKWTRQEVYYEKEQNFKRSPEELKKLVCPAIETYIITSAQNNTGLDKKYWKGLNRLAAYYDAQIFVLKQRYYNPTNPDQGKEAWWPKEVLPFMLENELHLPYGVRIMGNVCITATAVNPLTGFESVTQGDSAIFGHSQIQQKTVATPQNKLPKILTSTGSTSLKNYSNKPTGIKGDFHHSLGAVIVELDHDLQIAHIRVVTGDENSEFYDLNLHVTHRRVKVIKSLPALVTGDEHHKFMSDEVAQATYIHSDSIVQVCRPKYGVRHDIVDSYTISHHHRQNPSIRYAKAVNDDDSLEDEMWISVNFLKDTTPDFMTNVIVPSNHHNHIKRWLEETEWRHDMVNAKIYHEMWVAWLKAIDEAKDFHPFNWWMKQHDTTNTLWLTNDYPFIVEGIYLGYHGDRGPNGARGSIKNMSKIGAKTVIGHTHSPGIEKGCYQVGTSTWLSLEYTSGPSSWHNTHCLVHPNGKRQLVNIVDGEWRKQR